LFLTLEDETGTVNVVVWKKVWEQYRKVILTSSLLGVSGKLQSEEGVVHLIADRFWPPEQIGTDRAVQVPSRDFQ
jgi:error-prone DNA polymerase